MPIPLLYFVFVIDSASAGHYYMAPILAKEFDSDNCRNLIRIGFYQTVQKTTFKWKKSIYIYREKIVIYFYIIGVRTHPLYVLESADRWIGVSTTLTLLKLDFEFLL